MPAIHCPECHYINQRRVDSTPFCTRCGSDLPSAHRRVSTGTMAVSDLRVSTAANAAAVDAYTWPAALLSAVQGTPERDYAAEERVSITGITAVQPASYGVPSPMSATTTTASNMYSLPALDTTDLALRALDAVRRGAAYVQNAEIVFDPMRWSQVIHLTIHVSDRDAFMPSVGTYVPPAAAPEPEPEVKHPRPRLQALLRKKLKEKPNES